MLKNLRQTSTLALIVLNASAIHAASAATPSIDQIEYSMSSEARAELDELLTEPYRGPAVLGAATDEPSGENAHLYLNAPRAPTFSAEADSDR